MSTRPWHELVAKVRELSKDKGDPFGIQAAAVSQFLPFFHAKPFVKRGVTERQWAKARKAYTEEMVVAIMRASMPAAWKAANEANESATEVRREHVVQTNNHMGHLLALVWLLGDEEADAAGGFLRPEDYCHFGKPQLVVLCTRYELGDWKQWDNDRWADTELGIILPAKDAMARWMRPASRSTAPSPEPRPLSSPEPPSTPS